GKRRGGAPIGAPVRVMGRPFPSAEGTGFAARRATGCGDPHQRLSALRPPWALGGFAPLGWGQIPNGGRAHAPPERRSMAHGNDDEQQASSATAAPCPQPDNTELAERTRGSRGERFGGTNPSTSRSTFPRRPV